MLFVDFLLWWYGQGWAGTFTRSEYYAKSLASSFSVGTLLKTLFAPWKQMDAFGVTNQGLDAKFRHAVDKFVSRFVGFFVRFFTVVAALVSLFVLALLRVTWVLLWPFLPLGVLGLLLYGLGVIF